MGVRARWYRSRMMHSASIRDAFLRGAVREGRKGYIVRSGTGLRWYRDYVSAAALPFAPHWPLTPAVPFMSSARRYCQIAVQPNHLIPPCRHSPGCLCMKVPFPPPYMIGIPSK